MYVLKVTDEFKSWAFFSEMPIPDEEVFNKVDFVEASGADFVDTVAEESDTEEAQEGTDSTYETEEEPTTETESEDEGHLTASQYKRLVWLDLYEQFESETLR